MLSSLDILLSSHPYGFPNFNAWYNNQDKDSKKAPSWNVHRIHNVEHIGHENQRQIDSKKGSQTEATVAFIAANLDQEYLTEFPYC